MLSTGSVYTTDIGYFFYKNLTPNICRRITEFGPPMLQAEADAELTLSASPATAVGQSKLYPGESRLEYGTTVY